MSCCSGAQSPPTAGTSCIPTPMTAPRPTTSCSHQTALHRTTISMNRFPMGFDCVTLTLLVSTSLNPMFLHPCSISAVVSEHGGCFVAPATSYCGNTFVEAGEQCDCGGEIGSCSYMEPHLFVAAF
jgi:hypothetical protein